VKTPTIKDIRAAAAARKARARRNRWLALGVGPAVLLLALAVMVVLPRVVRTQVEERLGAALQRPVTVERVALNPLQLAATLENLVVTDPTGGDFVRWDQLRVNLTAWSLLAGEWRFDEIAMTGFTAHVRVDEQGALNFADLLASEAPAAADADSAERPVVHVDRLTVTDARIAFEDRNLAQPFATELGPVSFTLDSFRTEGDPRAPYEFRAVSEAGETLTWHGGISVNPLRSRGELAITGLPLAKYAPYYADRVRFRLTGGTLDLKVGYELNLGGGVPDLRLVSGEGVLAGLRLEVPEQPDPIIALSEVTLAGLTGDLRENWVRVREIKLADGQVRAARTVAGIDLAAWLSPVGDPEAPSFPAAATGVNRGPPQWQVDALGWRDLAVALTDMTLAEPAAWELTALSGQVRNLASAPDQVIEIEAAGALGAGQLTLAGTFGFTPFAPALMVRATGLSVAAFSPYFMDTVGVAVPQGLLQAEVRLGGRGPAWTASGQAQLDGVQVQNGAGADLGGWEQLRLNEVEYSASPASLAVGRVRWVRPHGTYALDAAGKSNFASLGTAPSAAEDEPGSTPAPALAARVDLIELVGARLTFADNTLERPARIALTELSGTLGGWSSRTADRAVVNLTGKIDGAADVRVSGQLNPLGGHTTSAMQIELNRANLMPLDGYVRKFGGYALDGGRLTLAVNHRQSAGVIDSGVVATLDGFNLGARTPGPDVTSLPVGLAVALLKDSAGRIEIDVPIEGRTDDPEFRFGRVVSRVLVNLLTRVATSPFALLGAVVGAEAADLDTYVFSPGQAELTAAATAKLDEVAAALRARPELTVAVTGHHDGATDAVALRGAILERSLREQAGLGPAGNASWTDALRMQTLIDAYIQVFGVPPIDEASAPGPVVIAPPMALSEPRTGFWASLRRLLLGPPVGDPGNASAPGSTENATPSPAPAGGLKPLPAAEIEARLRELVQVAPTELAQLATARREAVVAELVRAGVTANRIARVEPSEDEATVTLSLR